MKELKLGIIACIHGNLKAAKALAKFYSKADVDAIIFAGDINKDEDQNSIYKVLKHFKKIKKPIYLSPGSHETYEGYKKSIKKIRKKNVIDCSIKKNRKIKIKGYNLVFLPGSDVTTYGAGFKLIGSKDKWAKDLKRGIKRYKAFSEYIKEIIEVNEVKKYVKNSKKTILICHVPPKFNKEKSIDVAKFGSPKKAFLLKLKDFKKRVRMHVGSTEVDKETIFPIWEAKRLIKKGYPIKIIEKNVGNIELKKIIKELKITKFICGHIHEAGQRSNDLKGNLVKQNKWSKELFYNAAPSLKGYSGIYTIKGNEAKYKNIKVKI